MKKIVIFLFCIIITLTVFFRLEHMSGRTPIRIGVPINSLSHLESDKYKITNVSAVTNSYFEEMYADVSHNLISLLIEDGIIYQHVIIDSSGITPKIVLFSYKPNQIEQPTGSLNNEFAGKYNEHLLGNGAVYYKHQSMSILPTTEFTYYDSGEMVEAFSVCDYVVYTGNNIYVWAVLNSDFSMDEILFIADYMIEMTLN